MIRFFLFAMKMAIFAAVVLVISQIPVARQRICDHVRDVVTHSHVQRPIHWVATRFNFLEGHHPAPLPQEHSQAKASDNGDNEHNRTDRHRLSGLLKETH